MLLTNNSLSVLGSVALVSSLTNNWLVVPLVDPIEDLNFPISDLSRRESYIRASSRFPEILSSNVDTWSTLCGEGVKTGMGIPSSWSYALIKICQGHTKMNQRLKNAP